MHGTEGAVGLCLKNEYKQEDAESKRYGMGLRQGQEGPDQQLSSVSREKNHSAPLRPALARPRSIQPKKGNLS